MDREKVIKGLEVCTSIEDGESCPKECPYYQDVCYGYDQLMRDALALLKEQEAVEPILEQDSMVCGVCGHEVIWQKMIGDGIWVDEELDYCPHCGREVKWNG